VPLHAINARTHARTHARTRMHARMQELLGELGPTSRWWCAQSLGLMLGLALAGLSAVVVPRTGGADL
jgi:hypothetical protein